jgi:hypothetical protein
MEKLDQKERMLRETTTSLADLTLNFENLMISAKHLEDSNDTLEE